jgi:hypothetical protein
MIVGSANVSAAALGMGDEPGRLLEAGTFHPPGSDQWIQGRDWFEIIHGKAEAVGESALEWARLAYRPPRPGGPARRPPMPGSLLDAVRLAPERFAAIGFVFTSEKSSDEAIAQARKSAKKLKSSIDRAAIDAWPKNGMFTEWDAKDVRVWPSHFFEFWRPHKRLTVFGRAVGVLDPDNGSVLSRNKWPQVAKKIGGPLPPRSAVGRADNGLADLIFDEEGGPFFADGQALAAYIAALEVKYPAHPAFNQPALASTKAKRQ